MKIRMVKDAGAIDPVRAYKHDAGLDLKSPYDAVIPAHGFKSINTGVHLEIPVHFCGVLISKSGLNTLHGIQSTGLIDAEYTGPIVVTLLNNSDTDYTVKRGDKISQIVILHIPEIEVVPADALLKSERGNNGFGSTGRR